MMVDLRCPTWKGLAMLGELQACTKMSDDSHETEPLKIYVIQCQLGMHTFSVTMPKATIIIEQKTSRTCTSPSPIICGINIYN